MDESYQSSVEKKEFKSMELIEIRDRIKRETGFIFDEDVLGLDEEMNGIREFQRLQAPLPSFLTEKKKEIYSKLLRDLITNIKIIKDEIFNVENKMIKNLKDIKTGLLKGNPLDKKNKEYSHLESSYISLIMKLMQAEEEYKALVNNIEIEKRAANESTETITGNRPEQEIKSNFNFLDEQKKVSVGRKDRFTKELENTARVKEECFNREEEWRERREEHRKFMLHFIHECQERINLLNINIKGYQKQLLSMEQRLLTEKNDKMKLIYSKAKKELEILLLDSKAQLFEENETIQETTKLLNE